MWGRRWGVVGLSKKVINGPENGTAGVFMWPRGLRFLVEPAKYTHPPYSCCSPYISLNLKP